MVCSSMALCYQKYILFDRKQSLALEMGLLLNRHIINDMNLRVYLLSVDSPLVKVRAVDRRAVSMLVNANITC